jgi:hypothetical protein
VIGHKTDRIRHHEKARAVPNEKCLFFGPRRWLRCRAGVAQRLPENERNATAGAVRRPRPVASRRRGACHRGAALRLLAYLPRIRMFPDLGSPAVSDPFWRFATFAEG